MKRKNRKCLLVLILLVGYALAFSSPSSVAKPEAKDCPPKDTVAPTVNVFLERFLDTYNWGLVMDDPKYPIIHSVDCTNATTTGYVQTLRDDEYWEISQFAFDMIWLGQRWLLTKIKRDGKVVFDVNTDPEKLGQESSYTTDKSMLGKALIAYPPQPVWVVSKKKCKKVDVQSWAELDGALKRQIGPFEYVKGGVKAFALQDKKKNYGSLVFPGVLFC